MQFPNSQLILNHWEHLRKLLVELWPCSVQLRRFLFPLTGTDPEFSCLFTFWQLFVYFFDSCLFTFYSCLFTYDSCLFTLCQLIFSCLFIFAIGESILSFWGLDLLEFCPENPDFRTYWGSKTTIQFEIWIFNFQSKGIISICFIMSCTSISFAKFQVRLLWQALGVFHPRIQVLGIFFPLINNFRTYWWSQTSV